MALIQVNYMSQTLMRSVPVNVILPVDKLIFSGDQKQNKGPFKTLYLLHGMFGSYIDWIAGSDIQRLAEARNLAVVMPSGDNGFYIDHIESGNMYGEYIGKELVEVTRRMFPLSDKREDTFIGGLSMGGFGALRNGLKYSDTFGRIIGMSSGVITDNIYNNMSGNDFKFGDMKIPDSMGFAANIFGTLLSKRNSDINPEWIAKQLIAQGKEVPKMYITCGTEDPLLSSSWEVRDSFRKMGIDVTYEEQSGSHNWDFWNKAIVKALEWLPLDEPQAGLNSGNIVF